ncbi:hypothetical protein [Microvirga solisilvae]|uniref:hypothetical protein n=1 Tax=Microvirga solisilvae TaxID=2919498 RepID=UPI001FAEB1DD|nr:hypothetical protein [Microvirga solisilvae]
MTRKDTISGWKRAALAALVAYALVLQTVLVSLSGAAHAAEAAGPQGILCLQDGQARPDHDPAKAHDGLCCILSCHHAGTGGPLSEAVSLEQPLAVVLIAHGPVVSSHSPVTSTILPVGSRAPPRLG